MRRGWSLWLWSAVLVSVFPVAVALILIYSRLPADGATGNLESFRSDGFDAQWLFERREGGLQAGDLIVRAGGYTLAEWLAGAPRRLRSARSAAASAGRACPPTADVNSGLAAGRGIGVG